MTKLQTIVLVDDDPTQWFLTEWCLRQEGFTCTVHGLEHGGEAIAYMNGDGKYSDRVKYPFRRLESKACKTSSKPRQNRSEKIGTDSFFSIDQALMGDPFPRTSMLNRLPV